MADLPVVKKKKNWFVRHKILTGILVLIIIGIAATSSSKKTDTTSDNTSSKTATSNSTPAASSSTNTQPAAPAQPSHKSYKAGTYKVGNDIPAGEYRLIASGGAGYMQVATDSTGSLDSIVSNSNFTTNDIVTVAAGQYFTVTRATAYPIDDSPSVDTSKEGTFKVGKDIQPAEYKITSDGSGYVQVSSDSTGSVSSIVSNNNFDGDSYITVAAGQYLTLTRAHIVK